MLLYDYIWQEYTYTGISTGSYIMFDQVLPIDNWTNVPGPVAQSSAKSDYNTACTSGMDLAHSRMLNN